MDSVHTLTRLKGSLCYRLLFFFFFIWPFIFQDDSVVVVLLVAAKLPTVASHLASPPSVGLFEPIEISPSVLPHYPFPEIGGNLLPPMYPAFPPTYNPILTGRCPVNFSSISTILDTTAADCSQPLAAFVGNVICCPQFASLLRLFQGYYSSLSHSNLVLQDAVADDCFTDILSILASRGANSSIATLCSAKSSNLTGGSCPVKDINTYEKVVNSSKLLEACSAVDPLKECCRPICQPAIMAAALQISSSQSIDENMNIVRQPTHVDALNDCKGVVYSWMSRKLPLDTANSAFRILSACKVNKVCPLEFKQPSEVIKACRNVAAPSPFCCSSLSTYIAGIQKQMLITNRQAIICATMFGSMLKKGGVLTDLYELCDIDLKDFSLQAYGQQGCLLRSLPADVVDDNSSGMSFTCDLNDNIAAPWPSSSSMSSLSLCAPEMSLPALPTSETLGSPGSRRVYLDILVTIFSPVVFGLLL